MSLSRSKEPDPAIARAIAEDGCVTDGRISLPVPEPARSDLMRVRGGEVPLPDVLTELHDLTARLERAVLSSELAEGPDQSAIDRFLIDAYERAWAAAG